MQLTPKHLWHWMSQVFLISLFFFSISFSHIGTEKKEEKGKQLEEGVKRSREMVMGVKEKEEEGRKEKGSREEMRRVTVCGQGSRNTFSKLKC